MYCLQPFYNIHMRPNGGIVPCCKYIDSNPINLLDAGSLDEYLNGEGLKNLQQAMIDENPPEGCQGCYGLEQNGFMSKRLDSYKTDRHIIETQQPGIKKISLNIGNTCNLKCRICNPTLSTAWRDEWQLLHNEDVKSRDLWVNHPEIVDSVIDALKDIVHIDWCGGEPFVQPKEPQLKMLDAMINSGRAKEITLHYTTNGSIYPSDEFWNRWQHFNLVDLQFSMDDIGERFEYNRYPLKWDTFVKNLFAVRDRNDSNLQLSLAICLSIFTVDYVKEINDWCKENNLPAPWYGPVEYPAYYNPRVDKSPELVKQFWEITKKLDTIRGQDFKLTFPKLYERLKNETSII